MKNIFYISCCLFLSMQTMTAKEFTFVTPSNTEPNAPNSELKGLPSVTGSLGEFDGGTLNITLCGFNSYEYSGGKGNGVQVYGKITGTYNLGNANYSYTILDIPQNNQARGYIMTTTTDNQKTQLEQGRIVLNNASKTQTIAYSKSMIEGGSESTIRYQNYKMVRQMGIGDRPYSALPINGGYPVAVSLQQYIFTNRDPKIAATKYYVALLSPGDGTGLNVQFKFEWIPNFKAPVLTPDLTITSVSGFQLAYGNTQVQYDYQVKNLGNGATTKNVSVNGFWSKDATLSADDPAAGGSGVNPLAANGVATGKFTMNVPPEAYYPNFKGWTLGQMLKNYPYLILKVDSENQIAESNENNNIYAVRHNLSLQDPPITLGTITGRLTFPGMYLDDALFASIKLKVSNSSGVIPTTVLNLGKPVKTDRFDFYIDYTITNVPSDALKVTLSGSSNFCSTSCGFVPDEKPVSFTQKVNLSPTCCPD
jgi:hypothetical protein